MNIKLKIRIINKHDTFIDPLNNMEAKIVDLNNNQIGHTMIFNDLLNLSKIPFRYHSSRVGAKVFFTYRIGEPPTNNFIDYTITVPVPNVKGKVNLLIDDFNLAELILIDSNYISNIFTQSR